MGAVSLDVYLSVVKQVTVFELNITHNLGRMADIFGLYQALWCPEELEIKKAHDLIPSLAMGLAKLIAEPDKARELNPENGWGSYEGLVTFVKSYLSACIENPDADVSVSK